MNRRNFLKGAAAISGISLIPKAAAMIEPHTTLEIVKDKENGRYGYREIYAEYEQQKPIIGDIDTDGGVYDGSYWVYNLGSIQKR